MSSNLGNRSGHSYLCLVAIYAIHVFVFHVYYSPEIPTARRKVSSRLRETSIVENATTTEGLGNRDDVEEESIVGRIAKHNETSEDDRFTVDEEYCFELRTHGDKIGDDLVTSCIAETVRWTFPKCVRFDLVRSLVLSSVTSSGTFTTVLTPATWGVLLGCLVFLFTYKEREHCDTAVT